MKTLIAAGAAAGISSGISPFLHDKILFLLICFL
jgi:hypothetical protein